MWAWWHLSQTCCGAAPSRSVADLPRPATDSRSRPVARPPRPGAATPGLGAPPLEHALTRNSPRPPLPPVLASIYRVLLSPLPPPCQAAGLHLLLRWTTTGLAATRAATQCPGFVCKPNDAAPLRGLVADFSINWKFLTQIIDAHELE